MKPWISVIVPVYNVEKYLEKCVYSLIKQSFSNSEIILIDDGSTDSSGKICDDFAQKYGNIIAVHKANGGLATARNAGLEYAKGEYVTFVDSDDWMEQEAYEVMYAKCQECKPDILNYGYQKVYDKKIIIQEHAAFPEGLYNGQDVQNIILPDSIAREKAFDQVNLPVQLSACMCIYRRSFLEENGLRFESERIVLNEDWLFNICCLCHAQSILILHNIFYNYFTRDTSVSQSYKTDAYPRRKILYHRYREELANIRKEDPEIEKRLRNFWMESIYCCYIIELNAPKWNKDVKKRMDQLCRDPEFQDFSRKMTWNECTVKGHLFRLIVRFRLHEIMRTVYWMKRRLNKA